MGACISKKSHQEDPYDLLGHRDQSILIGMNAKLISASDCRLVIDDQANSNKSMQIGVVCLFMNMNRNTFYLCMFNIPEKDDQLWYLDIDYQFRVHIKANAKNILTFDQNARKPIDIQNWNKYANFQGCFYELHFSTDSEAEFFKSYLDKRFIYAKNAHDPTGDSNYHSSTTLDFENDQERGRSVSSVTGSGADFLCPRCKAKSSAPVESGLGSISSIGNQDNQLHQINVNQKSSAPPAPPLPPMPISRSMVPVQFGLQQEICSARASLRHVNSAADGIKFKKCGHSADHKTPYDLAALVATEARKRRGLIRGDQSDSDDEQAPKGDSDWCN